MLFFIYMSIQWPWRVDIWIQHVILCFVISSTTVLTFQPKNLCKTTPTSYPSFVQLVLGGNPRIFSKTLCPPDRQCSWVHPQPWSGPPWCQAWKHPAVGQSLLPGQAGRLRPCPEERHSDTLHHRNSTLHGPWALYRGPAGGPEGSDRTSA